jgi:hypothetical protein
VRSCFECAQRATKRLDTPPDVQPAVWLSHPHVPVQYALTMTHSQWIHRGNGGLERNISSCSSNFIGLQDRQLNQPTKIRKKASGRMTRVSTDFDDPNNGFVEVAHGAFLLEFISLSPPVAIHSTSNASSLHLQPSSTPIVVHRMRIEFSWEWNVEVISLPPR